MVFFLGFTAKFIYIENKLTQQNKLTSFQFLRRCRLPQVKLRLKQKSLYVTVHLNDHYNPLRKGILMKIYASDVMTQIIQVCELSGTKYVKLGMWNCGIRSMIM